MLVTSQRPLKRAADLTSLVWVCVLLLPWKLNGAICAMTVRLIDDSTKLITPWTKWSQFRRRYFRCIFVNGKFCNIIKISLRSVPRGQFKITQRWFRLWLGVAPNRRQLSHYLNQCSPYSLTHICVNRGRWVTSPRVNISASPMCFELDQLIRII